MQGRVKKERRWWLGNGCDNTCFKYQDLDKVVEWKNIKGREETVCETFLKTTS